MFSKPYFFQLQGHKFTRGFITFHKQSTISELQYNTLVAITEKYMSRPITVAYADYIKHTKYLLLEYIKSMCKLDVNFTEYTALNTIPGQLLWLFKYCKKTKDIWPLRMLMRTYIYEDYNHLIYKKDITSSSGL